MARPRPLTDAEVHGLLSLLRNRPRGVPREEVANYFGGGKSGDRRARDAVAALCERSLAAVVHRRDDIFGEVYRIARDRDELESELTRLDAYIGSLAARRDGLVAAFDAGGTRQPQAPLFEMAGT